MYFDVWREDLAAMLGKFETWRIDTNFYFLKVFIFFVLINDLAYWFAIATAYSEIFATEKELVYYSKVQFPVAILGALFDSLSLYVTLLVVRRALRSQSNMSYISHLSIDMLIAMLCSLIQDLLGGIDCDDITDAFDAAKALAEDAIKAAIADYKQKQEGIGS